MKKAIAYWYAFLLILLWMTSCKTASPVAKEVTTKVITEKVHDTIFKIEKDSSYYQAYIECINGKPVLTEPKTETPGKSLNKPKVNLDGNKLTVECEKKAQELFAQWKSKHVVEETIIEVPIEVVKPLTWFQTTQIYCGRLLFIIIIIAIVRWLIKKQFNAFGL